MMHTVRLHLGRSLADHDDPSGYSQHAIRAGLAARMAGAGPAPLRLIVDLADWPARCHPHDFVIDALCDAAGNLGSVSIPRDSAEARRACTWAERWRRRVVIIEYRADDPRAADHFVRDTLARLAYRAERDRQTPTPQTPRRAPRSWWDSFRYRRRVTRPSDRDSGRLSNSGEVRP
jgi:hypothetical protein